MIAKEPPREKIFEAWSAVASGRVQFAGAPDAKTGDAEVESSNGEKKYFVSWSDGRYGSDDPATWWQKYPGYPILAVLMLQGKLPYDAKIASLFKNVNWTDANAAARRDYALAFREVCAALKLSPETIAEAEREATRTLEILKTLDIAASGKKGPKRAR